MKGWPSKMRSCFLIYFPFKSKIAGLKISHINAVARDSLLSKAKDQFPFRIGQFSYGFGNGRKSFFRNQSLPVCVANNKQVHRLGSESIL